MRLYLDLVRGTLVELKAAGRLHDVDPTVAAFSVLGMVLWLPRWFRQDGRLSQERVASEITRMALGGLLRDTQPARSSNPKILRSPNARNPKAKPRGRGI